MSQALPLGALVTANLLIAVVIQAFVIVTIGPGPETDALFASLTTPQLVLLLTSGPVTRVLVPLFAEHVERPAALQRDAWTFLQVATGTAALVAFALGATSPLWVPWLFPGFAPHTGELAVVLTRIQLVGVVFTVASTVLSAFHQSRHGFLRVEAVLLCGAVAGAIGVIVAVRLFGVVGVACASVGQAAIQAALLVPGLGRYRVPWVRSVAVVQGWRRMLPLVAGALYSKNERVVDRLLASLGQRGELSLLAVAQQVYTVPALLLNRVVTGPLVPRLTRELRAGDPRRFRSSYRGGLCVVLALTVAGYLLVWVSGEPALRLLVGRGRVTVADIHLLWLILLALGGYLVAGGCGQVVSAAFYAQGDTMTPTWVGIASFTISIPLRIAGLWMLGVPGIALGASAYHALNAATLLAILEGRMSSRLSVSPAGHVSRASLL